MLQFLVKKRARLAFVGVVGLVAMSLSVGAMPALAAKGTLMSTWYTIPSFKGTVAAARVNYMTLDLQGDGDAGGRISIDKRTGKGRTYVQYKPDPRGPGGWNRGTANHSVKSAAATYNWSDHFVFYTTGYKFRICKVRAFADPCGTVLLIEPLDFGS